MSESGTDPLDFLESDDLISWLIAHPDGSNDENNSSAPVVVGAPASVDNEYGHYISEDSSSDSEDESNSPRSAYNDAAGFRPPAAGYSAEMGGNFAPSKGSAAGVSGGGSGRAKHGSNSQLQAGNYPTDGRSSGISGRSGSDASSLSYGGSAGGSSSSTSAGNTKKRSLSRSTSGSSLASSKGSAGNLSTGMAGPNSSSYNGSYPSSSVGSGYQTLGGNNSNKRKKMVKIEEVEERIRIVAKENADLQAHLMTVQRRTIELQRQRVLMEKQMESKVSKMLSSMAANKNGGSDGGSSCSSSTIASSASSSSGAAAAGVASSSSLSSSSTASKSSAALSAIEDEGDELKKMIQQYSSMYADYGEYRKKEVAFHLQQLERLLLPTKTTKLILWALHQDKSFYSPSSPLFQIFCNELGITEEQSKRLQERRDKVMDLIAQLKESLSLIKALKTAIDDKHRMFDTTCGLVESIGTPRQIVSFLLWITKKADKLSQVIPDFWKAKEPVPDSVAGGGAGGASV